MLGDGLILVLFFTRKLRVVERPLWTEEMKSRQRCWWRVRTFVDIELVDIFDIVASISRPEPAKYGFHCRRQSGVFVPQIHLIKKTPVLCFFWCVFSSVFSFGFVRASYTCHTALGDVTLLQVSSRVGMCGFEDYGEND